MTNLYFIRHGIAANREDYSQGDRQRPLTPEGIKKTTKVAHRLQELGITFDLILTSPLVRAQQTAEILQTVGLSKALQTSSDLAPEGDLLSWWQEGKKWRKYENLALVGHEPNLGHWAELLVWGEVKSGLIVKKAGVIGITLPDSGSPVGNSDLFWLTPPRFLLN
ncbi:phosphohistidine phosphatase SixA [Roseofilum capinflatum]|uniref:Phosphohistidine phosphatase SixA n=1 Tax=Roseofilum capinflatum BLCC-M114 TaxID=3022440 RepID=A0ABT7B9G9_9CYAN|nr:phosphohistidine phosphatase SixA [Roseofilum capinflatum]MDJ1175809.1 phosphohistidine phosphatase SixA [Roseofilum capinflatum BLCC-M114]